MKKENDNFEQTANRAVKKYKVANCSMLNIRKEPSLNSEIIKTVVLGHVIKAYVYNVDWVCVIDDSNNKYYCKREFLQEVENGFNPDIN